MKEIKAYVRNQMVDRVIDAIAALPGAPEVAVVPLREFRDGSDDEAFRRVEMTKLELDVPDDEADVVVDCIVRNARTGPGHRGDGRVLLSDVADAVRISDGFRGDEALRG